MKTYINLALRGVLFALFGAALAAQGISIVTLPGALTYGVFAIINLLWADDNVRAYRRGRAEGVDLAMREAWRAGWRPAQWKAPE